MQNMQMPTELIVRGTTAPPPEHPHAQGKAGQPHGEALDRDSR